MPRRAARLAKLTRPRLHEVLDRRRLFGRLDQERARPLVWVIGPPGAGKTALVASYLDARDPESIWLHLDPGDGEVATFFHYLSQSLETPARRAPLPVITPEYRANLEGFTRYYFREFFARMPSPAVLVFDNYQDIPAESALHRVLHRRLARHPRV